MASQSSLAESGQVVTADQINHQQKMYSHPDYRFEPMFPNTFGQPINITSSQTPSVINLPPTEVYNLSQSYLLYTVNIPPPTAGSYIWTYQDTLAEISHMQFYVGANQLLCDVDQLQNYLKIIMKREVNNDDFLTLDPLGRLYQSNSLVNAVPALRNNATALGVASATPNPSSINYVEPAYFSVGVVSAAVSYNVQFPLRLIKNTIFSRAGRPCPRRRRPPRSRARCP